MDFSSIAVDILSSLLLVLKRFFLLIITPYKTMRKISLENDYWQIAIILFLVFLYFKFIYYLRPNPYPATFVFIIFIFNFSLTVLFFYFFSKKLNKDIKLSNFIFTLSYSLFPTLIWFIVNSFLFLLIPPPRTLSILGRVFSIFFISFSVSFLIWKIILVYLAIRFSSKLNFYRIIYSILLYLCLFLPYSVFLYQLKIFRVPFI
jgi:hypothetical protein